MKNDALLVQRIWYINLKICDLRPESPSFACIAVLQLKNKSFHLPSKNVHPLKAAQQVSFQDTTASTLSSSFLKLSQDTELQKLLREKLQGPEGESDLVRVVQWLLRVACKTWVACVTLRWLQPFLPPKKKKNIGFVGSLFCKVKH